MKIYDNVKLIEEVEKLAKKGIHKDYQGTVVKISGSDITVCFYNLYNLGEYAFATVDEKYLEFIIRADEKIILEMQEFLSNVNLEKYTTLRECDVKEYDVVELIAEKPKYTLAGVRKGDRGCVISSYAVDNYWQIIFSHPKTGKDIAQISVKREDFKIIDKF